MSFSFSGLPASNCERCGAGVFLRFGFDLACEECLDRGVVQRDCEEVPDERIEATWSIELGGLRWRPIAKTRGFSRGASSRVWVTRSAYFEVGAIGEQFESIETELPRGLYIPLTNFAFAWLMRRLLNLANANDGECVPMLVRVSGLVQACLDCGLATDEMQDASNWPCLDNSVQADPFAAVAPIEECLRVAAEFDSDVGTVCFNSPAKAIPAQERRLDRFESKAALLF